LKWWPIDTLPHDRKPERPREEAWPYVKPNISYTQTPLFLKSVKKKLGGGDQFATISIKKDSTAYFLSHSKIFKIK